MLVDLKVAQLLCSRLCHDLVGPAGAVNAGLELISDEGADPAEALALIGLSARQVAARLAFYRTAFGQAGEDNGMAELAAARKLAEQFVAGGNVELDWPVDAGYDGSASLTSSAIRLVLNMVLLGLEALPRGGCLSVRFADLADGIGVAMTANGERAGLREDVRRSLESDVSAEDLSARTVQGYFAARLAWRMAAELEVTQGPEGEVRLAVVVPLA